MTDNRSAEVADELWDRVRQMAARIAPLEEAERRDELDDEGRARLASLRLRASRAANRAQLADDLADRLGGIRSRGTASPS